MSVSRRCRAPLERLAQHRGGGSDPVRKQERLGLGRWRSERAAPARRGLPRVFRADRRAAGDRYRQRQSPGRSAAPRRRLAAMTGPRRSFSNVSHEFRTPLTLMLGPLEDALGSPGRRLTDQNLEATHRNALRLLRLVNALLDFSRIESGLLEAWYEPVELARLTTELAGAFRPAIERAGLRYEVECGPLDEPVYVDRDKWEKIVLNLLSNASSSRSMAASGSASGRLDGGHRAHGA